LNLWVKMQVLWLENNELSVRDTRVPDRPAEALVKVRLAGICATDLELVRGYYPYTGILGHEFVGEVVETPDPPPAPPKFSGFEGRESAGLRVGQRVVGEINAVCGQCEQCLGGRATHCENRSVLGIVNRDGAFAEYLTLPLENLHPVPDNVPDEAAVFTEPLAAALEIREQVRIQPTDRVLVVGAGRLGQLIAQTLALTGSHLRVLARHHRQRELLAARGIRPIDEAEVRPRRWDVVVEATGSPGGFEVARRAVRPRGTLVMKSTYKGDLAVNFSSLVVDEITLVGSRCGPFEPALRLLESREVDPLPLIDGEYPLQEGLKAFERAGEPGELKLLLRP
jgi:threonine dehydrogenase-like Zn-dependent dehydrogenase